MKKLYYKGNQYIDSSVPVNATAAPTANTISKFDLDAKMNSTDMTDAQIEAYLEDVDYCPMLVNDTVPIGAIQAFGGVNAPKNWLMCDGSAVSRTTYAKLYSVIGTTYGQGDGATTFNLPDLRGRMAQGAGTLNSINYSIGDTKNAGLPNITGGFVARPTNYNSSPIIYPNDGANVISYSSGGFSGDSVSQVNGVLTGWNYTIDASRSNAIYGNSTTVQPNAVVVNYIIKYDDKEVTGGALQDIQQFLYEEGESGSWRWRKYTSGRVESWFYGMKTFTTAVNSVGIEVPTSIRPITTLYNLQAGGSGDGFVGDVHHAWVNADTIYLTATAAGSYGVSIYLVFKN